MLVPRLNHSLIVLSSLAVGSLVGTLNVWPLRVVTTHPLPADQTSHRLDATRELLFKLSMFKLSWRPESCLARTASLEAWPLGTSLMLLMKRATAQGGNALSFPHLGITKVGRDFPHPFRCPEARFTPVFRAPIFSRK